jgi:hypothetical protein
VCASGFPPAIGNFQAEHPNSRFKNSDNASAATEQEFSCAI